MIFDLCDRAQLRLIVLLNSYLCANSPFDQRDRHSRKITRTEFIQRICYNELKTLPITYKIHSYVYEMKLLIIEDEQELRDSIVGFFKEQRHVCEEAPNYRIAEEKLSEFDYDLVILDLTLPDGDGMNLISDLKLPQPETGLLILSARDSLDDKIDGLEFTLERFFNKGFYYMSTASLYRSLYTAKDGIKRRTAFDGNYVFNLIGGKEWSVGKSEKNKKFFLNNKLSSIGGSRYTPIDLESSIALGGQVRDETNPFTAKGDDIFKFDVALGLRRDRKRTTTEFKIEVLNASNSKAVAREYYDFLNETIVISTQLALIPVISYRINF